MAKLWNEKKKLDEKCDELEPLDNDKALEYAVTAQEYMNTMFKDFYKKLRKLHKDYQRKMNRMQLQLEDEWLKGKQKQNSPVQESDI